MANKGFDSKGFLLMRRSVVFGVSAKGVVYSFLGTQGPCAASTQRL